MSGPSLVLTPPTPSRSRPNSSRGTTPDLSIDQEPRSSSETTTIDTIYSLYGEDMLGETANGLGERRSWSASEIATHHAKDIGLPRPIDSSPNSFSLAGRNSPSNLAYLSRDTLPNGGAVHHTNTSSSLVLTHERPATTPHHGHSDTVTSAFTQSTAETSFSDPGPSQVTLQSTLPPSAFRGDVNRESLLSSSVHLSPPPSRVLLNSRSLPIMRIEGWVQPSVLPPAKSSSSRSSPQVLPIKPTIPSPTIKSGTILPPLLRSPISKISLVPSDGEEPDAFHVRSTYAQLDLCGVKGDGYEEGIERTRAKVGDSPESQMTASGALCDGSEKMQDLNPKELETLANLDRYGFFNQPSHDRLVRLPSSAFMKRLSRVRAGPPTAPTGAISLSAIPPSPVPPKEAQRITKWARMLIPSNRDIGGNVASWSINPYKQYKLRERTYKGIPDRWRSAAWEVLVSWATGSTKMDVEKLEQLYLDELEKPSTYDIQIDLDVPRTISGHIMFRTRYGAGQRSLFHVLHCFSLHCTECGYVQGMGPIAATLLCYFSPSHVYATLIRLHTHPFYALHNIFSPGFPGLLEAIYVQERIIERMMPDVYRSFQKNMISTTSYATKWYITLFANTVPFQCQIRLWDAFLLDGKDVFVAVAVGIVWAYRDQITSAEANFETILSLLSSVFVPESEDPLLAWIDRALEDKKLRASMSQWREEWQQLVATGKSSKALL